MKQFHRLKYFKIKENLCNHFLKSMKSREQKYLFKALLTNNVGFTYFIVTSSQSFFKGR